MPKRGYDLSIDEPSGGASPILCSPGIRSDLCVCSQMPPHFHFGDSDIFKEKNFSVASVSYSLLTALRSTRCYFDEHIQLIKI